MGMPPLAPSFGADPSSPELPDRIVIGGPLVTLPVAAANIGTLAGDLKRGQPMGQITTGGDWIVALDGAADGSKDVRGILAADAVQAANHLELYVEGQFNRFGIQDVTEGNLTGAGLAGTTDLTDPENLAIAREHGIVIKDGVEI